MPIVGAYDLHLYCDTKGCENAECRFGAIPFEASNCQTRGEAIQQARKEGWTVNWASGTCRCPAHSAPAPRCKDLIGLPVVLAVDIETRGGTKYCKGKRMVVYNTWRGKFDLTDPVKSRNGAWAGVRHLHRRSFVVLAAPEDGPATQKPTRRRNAI